MSESDLKLREVSVPFLALSFGRTVLGATDLGLIGANYASPAQNVSLRFSTPDNMQLKQCYLTMILKVATTQSLGVRVGIGQFQTGTYVADTIDTEQVRRDHIRLFGSESYISATAGNNIVIAGVDLLPLIPKAGDSNFRADGFVLNLCFDTVPDLANGYELTKFQINASAVLGVL